MSQTKSGSDGSSNPDSSFVSVDIYDQTYHLSGPDPAQIQRLAARVDACMRSVASASRTADSLRLLCLQHRILPMRLFVPKKGCNSLALLRDAAESAELHSRAVRLRGLYQSFWRKTTSRLRDPAVRGIVCSGVAFAVYLLSIDGYAKKLNCRRTQTSG